MEITCLRRAVTSWRTLVLLITPLVLLPLPIIAQSKMASCGYVLLLMSIYWLTEALPIAVTSIIPLLLFPALGVVPSKQVANNYFSDVTVMLLGGLGMAIAIEKCNLHKRIAWKACILLGTKPRWLLLGFMIPTYVLSMWMTNTATVTMMIPVVEVTIQQLSEHCQNRRVEESKRLSSLESGILADEEENMKLVSLHSPGGECHSNDTQQKQLEENRLSNTKQTRLTGISKALCLAVAYSATLGGITTLTGNGANMIPKHIIDKLYTTRGLGESPYTFANWFYLCLPISVIGLVLTWIWLQILFLGPKSLLKWGKKTMSLGNDISTKKIMSEQYRELGKFTFAELSCCVLLCLLMLSWLTRAPAGFNGWGSLFHTGFVNDAFPGVVILLVLFVFPAKNPLKKMCSGRQERDTLLDWHTFASKCPWSVLFVLGGGFSLAEGLTVTGLSTLLGSHLTILSSCPQWLMVMLLSTIVAILTEVTTNAATTAVITPLVADLALSIGLDPMILVLTVAISVSFAFMLPTATPPNTVVFAYRHLTVADMVRAGSALNIVGILITTLAINTWTYPIFQLNSTVFTGNLTTVVTQP